MIISLVTYILWGINLFLGLPWIFISIQYYYSLYFVDQDISAKSISLVLGQVEVFSFDSQKILLYFSVVCANTSTIYLLKRISQ